MTFNKTLLQDFLRIAISLLFIGAFVYFLRDKWHHSFDLLKQMNIRIFAFAWVLFILTNVLVAIRLKYVLGVQRIWIGFWKVFYYNAVGLFFNLFMPSSLGGDVVKAYYLSKASGSKLHSISCVLVDRLLGLVAVVVVAIIACTRMFSDQRLIWIVAVFALVFFTSILTLFSRRLSKRFQFFTVLIPTQGLKEKADKFYQTILEFRGALPTVALCIFISLIVQVLTIGIGFLVAQSLGMNVPFTVFMFVFPITGLISMLPSLGGFGVREFSLTHFLSSYGAESAAAFALAYDILIYGTGLFCGILFMIFDRKFSVKKAVLHDQ